MVVVNLRHEEYDVRIDRRSEWGNRFVIGVHGDREQVIEKYRNWLWQEIRAGRISKKGLADLHGKRLGCHCAPLACHGDVLVRAAAWAAAAR